MRSMGVSRVSPMNSAAQRHTDAKGILMRTSLRTISGLLLHLSTMSYAAGSNIAITTRIS